MALIDYAFREDASVLHLVCKVAAGWRKARKTYCYSEECKSIEMTGGVTVRARVSVFPVPATLSEHAANFVFASEWEGGDRSRIWYAVDPSCLRLNTRLYKPEGIVNEQLPWGTTNESHKLCVRWEDSFFDRPGHYRLSVLMVFNPPPNAPGPTVWEKGEGFFPGGLPSLGKRR
jgi:hypothetical protein